MTQDSFFAIFSFGCFGVAVLISIFRERKVENQRRMARIGVGLLVGAVLIVLTAVWWWALADLDSKVSAAMGTTAGFMAVAGGIIIVVISEQTTTIEDAVEVEIDLADEDETNKVV